MVQNAVPDSDVDAGWGWEDSTGGDNDGAMWDECDEVPSDNGTTYIRLSAVAFPDGDVTTGSWTSTPLWQKIDEPARDDADFVSTTINNSTDTFKVSLTDIGPPNTDEAHMVRVRVRVLQGNGSDVTMTVRLLQGLSLIRAQSFASLGTPAFATFTVLLTSSEASNITDYTDLGIEVEVATTETTDRDVDVSWANLEVGKDQIEFGLTNITDPDANSGHVLRLTSASELGQPSSAFASEGRISVTLKQGAADIAGPFVGFISNNQGWVTVFWSVSASDASAITDYTDLRILVEWEYQLIGEWHIVPLISSVYLETPDVVVPPPNVDVSHAELVTPDHADHEERESARTNLAEPIGDRAAELGERVIEPNPLLQEAPIDD